MSELWYKLTGKLNGDADSVDTLVVHLFHGTGGIGWVLVLNEGVTTLVAEVSDGAEFLEFVLEVFGDNLTLQATDVNLSIGAHF